MAALFDRIVFGALNWLSRRRPATVFGIMILSIFPTALLAVLIEERSTRAYGTLFAGIGSLMVVYMGAVAGMMDVWKWKLAHYGQDQDLLKAIQWRDFELLMNLYFRLEGYEVKQLGGQEADGGIDLIVKKDGKTSIVQCKQYRWELVGVKIVRETLGVMRIEHLDGAIVATTGSFSLPAEAIAERCPALKLIDGPEISRCLRERGELIKANAEEGIVRGEISSLMEELTEAAKNAARGIGQSIPVRRCKKCNRRMILVDNPKNGERYWGCQGFPKSKCEGWTVPLDSFEWEILGKAKP